MSITAVDLLSSEYILSWNRKICWSTSPAHSLELLATCSIAMRFWSCWWWLSDYPRKKHKRKKTYKYFKNAMLQKDPIAGLHKESVFSNMFFYRKETFTKPMSRFRKTQLSEVHVVATKKENPHPKKKQSQVHSMSTVYLPTWMVNLYGKLVGKYTIHWVSGNEHVPLERGPFQDERLL